MTVSLINLLLINRVPVHPGLLGTVVRSPQCLSADNSVKAEMED